MKFFFVTGLYRSGTTLLEKLLFQHPSVSIAFQPYPSFYHLVKKRFNEMQNISSVYPINTRLDNEYFEMQDFIEFLNRYKLSETDKVNLGSESLLHSSDGFIDLFKQLQVAAGKDLITKETLYVGSKEILCEDFIGTLLENGIRVIHIIRDPRDVLSSAALGKEYTGKVRPLLYTIRMWRKSVAFRIHYSEHPLFYSIRYEDLVTSPMSVMKELAGFMNVQEIELQSRLIDQQGNIWKSNSSFGKSELISSSSIGKYKEILDDNSIVYVNTLCTPELKYLNYECEDVKDLKEVFEVFKEPFPIDNDLFQHDYSVSEINQNMEIKRAGLLKTDRFSSKEIEKHYQFESVYKILKKHAI
ncbi:MAG: sulfotransferase [Sporocytophaga sp.]|uniref:sulfotransferase family protein n=1 Tax=Sporocytophaga sp. TaxID=2231183 RepID=UPI001B2F4847|nr:sulfotransferase [Sporocytophaga sp.]MBO9699723.1 sulfotransferase [Sporocytophaga sp.]